MRQRTTSTGKPTEWQFAEYCELNPEHLSQMKNGHREIGDKIARRIEQKLGKDYAWMDLRHDDLSPEEHRVGERFGKFSPEKQRLVLAMFASLETDEDDSAQSNSC